MTYDLSNCDCCLTCFAEMVAADVCGCSLDEAHDVWGGYVDGGLQDVPSGRGLGFDPSFIIFIIEALVPAIIQILENCPEPDPEAKVRNFRGLRGLGVLWQRRKLRLDMQDEGLSRREAKQVAKATVDRALSSKDAELAGVADAAYRTSVL